MHFDRHHTLSFPRCHFLLLLVKIIKTSRLGKRYDLLWPYPGIPWDKMISASVVPPTLLLLGICPGANSSIRWLWKMLQCVSFIFALITFVSWWVLKAYTQPIHHSEPSSLTCPYFSFFSAVVLVYPIFLLCNAVAKTTTNTTTVKPRPKAHMDMILFEGFLKSIDLIPQQQILQRHYLYYR